MQIYFKSLLEPLLPNHQESRCQLLPLEMYWIRDKERVAGRLNFDLGYPCSTCHLLCEMK